LHKIIAVGPKLEMHISWFRSAWTKNARSRDKENWKAVFVISKQLGLCRHLSSRLFVGRSSAHPNSDQSATFSGPLASPPMQVAVIDLTRALYDFCWYCVDQTCH